MTARRLSAVLAVALVGLGLPGAAAAGSNSAPWRYVVKSVSGSATWRYAGASGSGVDSVRFQGRIWRGAPLASASSVLQGPTTYTDQNSRGCGPVTHTKRRYYGGPSFSVRGSVVVVSWNFPLPDQSYCSDPMGSNIPRQLQAMMLEKLPMTRFTCARMVLGLRGQAQLAQSGILGKLSYHATVIIERT